VTTADGRLRYVSVLGFDDDWLGRLRAAVPGVEVLQYEGAKIEDVPMPVRATMDMLHTSATLPDPDETPALRCVQLDTSGVDHVRDTALWRSPVPITTLGGVSPVPLAEYVLFAILGFAHRLPAMLEVRAARTWPTPSARWDRFLPATLRGATVGIVGYGRIGCEIGRQLGGHGMHVIGVTRSGRLVPADDRAERHYRAPMTSDHDAEVEIVPTAELDSVVGRCDYLVVVCPLTEETSGLVDASIIAATKPGAVLVNVARGGIVDETALLAGLRSGQLGGAVLDVFDDEPLSPESPWWSEPNVFLTPHVAGVAPLYSDHVLELVATNLQRLLSGGALLNLVDRERGY
jgi:phosphoglycerate dehydrogenase-like enzyme